MPKNLLPMTMADCTVNDTPTKAPQRPNNAVHREGGASTNPNQESMAARPSGPENEDQHHDLSSTSLLYSDLLPSSALDNSNNSSNNNNSRSTQNNSNNRSMQYNKSSSAADDQLHYSLPLDGCAEEGQQQGEAEIMEEGFSHGQHHPHSRTKTTVVKSAGKKVLQVAVTRPWKSVKRRFTGHQSRHTGGGYGAMGMTPTSPSAADFSSPPSSPSNSNHSRRRRIAGLRSAGGAGGGDHSSSRHSHNSHPSRQYQPPPRLDGSDRELFWSARTAPPATSTSPTESVVAFVERALRQVALLLVAFLLGAHFSEHAGPVEKVAEYVGVAWITCAVIRWTAAWQEWRLWRRRQQQLLHDEGIKVEEQMPLLFAQENDIGDIAVEVDEDDNLVVVEERDLGEILHVAQSFESGEEGKSSDDSGARVAEKEELVAVNDLPPVEPQREELIAEEPRRVEPREVESKTVVHPSLNPFYVINTTDGNRAFPNSVEDMFPLETDYFTGKMLVLIRTPDVDDDVAPKGTAGNQPAVTYFRGRQRRFDFQFQLTLKKVPKGRVYFAVELSDSVKMGMIQRAFATAALAFVRTANPNVHYSISGTTERSDGRWESPHIAFPVEEGMDRVVATQPGEVPPPLGQEIFEDDASIKLRKKTQIDWKVGVTYTFSLYSSYADFLEWRCLNLPGIRPFDLSSLIGPQPIFLTLYELCAGENSKKQHYRCNTINIVRLEVCNAAKSRVGPATRTWLKNNGSRAASIQDIARIEKSAEAADHEGFAMKDDDVDSDEESGVDNESQEQDEDAAEELGFGIYVRSGDTVSLRGLLTDGEEALPRALPPCHLANGGGFAVLQEQGSAATIIIEKAGHSRVRRNARASSRLIKSGDTVIFKLVARGRKPDEAETTRYLSIHRGWWLKWVSSVPTKNGFFTVHTHETEYLDRRDEMVMAPETQSTYLTLGGSFWLRHKRWKQYRVGIASNPSPTYGGRMLGLHIPAKNGGGSTLGGGGGGKLDYNSGDEVDAVRHDEALQLPALKGEWMRPLQFQPYEVGGSFMQTNSTLEDTSFDEADNENKLVFSREQYNMDVPAWVDVFNRTDRLRTHAYVVRVLPPESWASPKGEVLVDEEKTEGRPFIRLRAGRDLAEVMRTGLKWRNRAASLQRPASAAATVSPPSPSTKATDSPLSPRQRAKTIPSPSPCSSELLEASSHSYDDQDTSPRSQADGSESSDEEWDIESDDGDAIVENLDGEDSPTPKRRGKGRKLIGKIAKSVKTTTTSAARTSVKVGMGTVNAGKATVNAGKAILPIRPKKPPLRKEPKTTKRHARKHRDNSGLFVDVKSRSMRRIERLQSRSVLLDSPSFLAGELSAPEQSCRSVSHMLSKMSAEPKSSSESSRFSSLLRSLVEDSTTDYDKSFLQGGALQIGVAAKKVDRELGALLLDTLVARSLWESHWREEWCGLYSKGVVFYAPLSNTPCLELPFLDIKSVRLLEEVITPLAGYPVLVIETAWLCHYCAFAHNKARQDFYERIEALLSENTEVSEASFRDNELAEARFWQGFQTSVESSRSDGGGGKWAKIGPGSKSQNRMVLNNRRMVFDLGSADSHDDDTNGFVEVLLSTALSFSFDALRQHPEAFPRFLDSTSLLRTIRLEEIDRQGPQAFCLFVNLYHCLLQHALLCSVNGPLHKRSFTHFMWTSCYEIGGDVFSLAELYSIVIRGNMSRPLSSKVPYIEAPKKSSSYRFYTLQYTNPNTNFLLNTADLSCPRAVPVLDPTDLEEQLVNQTACFIRRSVAVDPARKQVVLPRIMEVYRNDFAGDLSTPGSSYESLRYCFRYLDMDMTTKIYSLYDEEGRSPLVVKYHPLSEQFHSRLVQASASALLSSANPDEGLPTLPEREDK